MLHTLLSFAFAVLLFFTSSSALSENISYCGLTLSIDVLKPVDTDNVRVQIGTEDRIIARSNLEHWVTEISILDPNRRLKFSTDQLVGFVLQCSRTETVVVVSTALQEIFKRGEVNSFSARKFLALSESNKESIKLVLEDRALEASVRELNSAGQIQLISESLAEMFVLDPQWLRSNAIRLFYLLSEPIYSVLIDRVKEELDSDSSDYLSRLSYAQIMFGDERSKNAVFLAQATTLAQKLKQDGFDLAAIRFVIAKSQKSGPLLDLFYSKISSKLIGEAKRFLEAGKLDDAIRAATLLLPSRPTPDALVLVGEILDNVKTDPALKLNKQTHDLFAAYSKVDQALASNYVGLLEAQFAGGIEAAQLAPTEDILAYLLLVRPDPSSQNDRLRYQQALVYKQQGLADLFAEKTTQMQTGMSNWQSFQLFLIGVAVGSIILWFFGAISLTVLIWLIIRKVKLKRRQTKTRDALEGVRAENKPAESGPVESEGPRSEQTKFKKQGPSSEDSEAEASSFINANAMKAMNPVYISYERDLARFGLKGEVSLRALKTAYRMAVKESHPDLNPDQSAEQAKTFLDLTEVYERLLSLRKQLGIADE